MTTVEKARQDAEEYAKAHILGDWQVKLLSELLYDFASQREAAIRADEREQCAKGLRAAYDFFMGPKACGDFTCNCGKTDVCGICEIRQKTEDILAIRSREHAKGAADPDDIDTSGRGMDHYGSL